LVDAVAARLREAGIEEPRAEARLIVAHATGFDRAQQLTQGDRPISPEPALALARRRAAREPMAYILGSREFWGLDFQVGPGVLVPRPETETVIEAVLQALPDRKAPLRLLDLGTGSGCLLLTLLTLYPEATGIGIDRSATALAYAAVNRDALGLKSRVGLVCGDWLEPLAATFDLIVANPPYIATDEPRDAETEHEPDLALMAGANGLDAYRAIAAPAFAACRSGGMLIVEIGAGQVAAVTACLRAAGFTAISSRVDLAGWPRAVVAHRSAASAGRPRDPSTEEQRPTHAATQT
jgi:release factor glutamine methyltransferase